MLAKFSNIIFGVVFLILSITCISLVVKLDSATKKYNELHKSVTEEKVRVATLTQKVNEKLTEVVYVPSVKYEEKIIEAKPIVERVTTETVKIIDRPVFSNVCIDIDGLRQWNTLIHLADNPTPSSEPSE